MRRLLALAWFVLCLLGCAGGTASLPPIPAIPANKGAAESGAQQCKDTLLLPTSGIYVVTPLSKPLPDSVLALPSIDGVAIRVGWRALQPTAQPPDFSLIDQQLASARRFGKKVSLSFEAAIETPDWVFDLGARPYWFVLEDEGHICERRRLPIPWDPVYLDSLKQLIRAASRRFNRSDLLTHIKVTGPGGRRQSSALPHGAARTLSDGKQTCTSGDEVTEWQNVGYSRARALQAFRETLELFLQSFTSHRLAVVIDTQGFPPLDDEGRLIAGAAYDPDMVPALLKSALTGREGRILVQSNELTNTSGYLFPIRFSEEVAVGYQLRWAVSSDKSFRMNGGTAESPVSIFDSTIRRGVNARGRYIEVQHADAAEPQLTASVAGARVLLRRGGR